VKNFLHVVNRHPCPGTTTSSTALFLASNIRIAILFSLATKFYCFLLSTKSVSMSHQSDNQGKGYSINATHTAQTMLEPSPTSDPEIPQIAETKPQKPEDPSPQLT
jgi:hypothetical protein